MRKRTILYVKMYPENNQIIYSGIIFAEFVEFLPKGIENLIIISGDCSTAVLGTRDERCFTLLEGREQLQRLAMEDIYSFGDFCFVDYASPDDLCTLSEGQITELLYMGHMYKPLENPFFDQIQNRFAYISHDDGFFCKLYCREFNDFFSILLSKIAFHAKIPEVVDSKKLKDELFQLAISGILIDLDDMYQRDKCSIVRVYTVGEHLDMDNILNDVQGVKGAATQVDEFVLQ